MRKKIIILTEGGIEIGLGHITRCLALCESLKDCGLKPLLIVYGDNKVNKFLKKQKVEYKVENWLKKIKYIKDSVLIIDSYLAQKEVYSTLRKNNNIVIAIDDYNRIDYDAHIIISPTIYGTFLNYKQHSNSVYLLGPKYIILRKEFWDVPSKKINKTIKNIMITFGGDDLRNLTPRIIKLLKNTTYKLHVIIGKAFKCTSYISKYKKHSNVKFYFNLSAEEMLHLMLLSDVAISSCGQTLYELARVGVPTIGVIIAENQKLNARYFQKFGFLLCAGEYTDSNLEKYILNGLKILSEYNKRKLISKIGKKLVDGYGAVRVAKKIELYINSQI